MNLHKTLKTAVTKLNHLENPSLEAEVLLASLLDKHRTWLRTYPETKLSATQHLKYKWWIQQRAAHKPVAYITGNVVWNSLSLKVNKHTLIPRDETEILCHHIKTAQTISPKTILDIGTGSGCIAIWLKKQFPSAQVSAFDIAKNALKLAKKNAKQNQTENTHSTYSVRTHSI